MPTVTIDRNMLVVGATPPRPFSPVIAEDTGAALADRYATKAALQWIAALKSEIDRATDRLEKFKHGPHGARPANPTAQRKWIARAGAALGPCLLNVGYTPGTRGRGSYTMDILGTAPNEDPTWFGAGDGEARRWIKIFRIEGNWLGWRKPTTLAPRDIAAFSTHAACRLIQRGSVESETELREVLRAMLPRLSVVEAVTRERRALLLRDQWLCPVVVKGRMLVGVFAGPRAGQSPDVLVYKTFKTVDHLREDQLAPMRQLVEAFAGQGDIGVPLERLRERG